jgi:hypothetical protein
MDEYEIQLLARQVSDPDRAEAKATLHVTGHQPHADSHSAGHIPRAAGIAQYHAPESGKRTDVR